MKIPFRLFDLGLSLIITASAWAGSKDCRHGSKLCRYEGEIIISPLESPSAEKIHGMFICEAKCSPPRPLSGGELARFYERSKDRPENLALWKTVISNPNETRPLHEVLKGMIFHPNEVYQSKNIYQPEIELKGSKTDLMDFGRLYLDRVVQKPQEPTLLDKKQAKALRVEMTDPANVMINCLAGGGEQSFTEVGQFCTCGGKQKFINTVDYTCKNGRLYLPSKDTGQTVPTHHQSPKSQR